jgi:hypothetical protein
VGNCGDLFIAAYAVVVGPGGEETAWSDTYGKVSKKLAICTLDTTLARLCASNRNVKSA